MKLIFRNKKEILDIEDFEYRQELDLGFFLFEFLAFDFEAFIPDADADLPDTLLSGEGDPIEVLCYLINTEHDTNALITAQDVFRFACYFCLDMDYTEYPLGGLTAQQKWYILSKSGGYTEPGEFIEQLCGFSECTSIVQPGESFYSDALLHSDTDELETYHVESSDILTLIEKFRDTQLETLKIYETDSLFGILYAEFWSLVTGNMRIRKCGFCDKYFVPFSGSSDYCAREVADKGKSCKDYAPMVVFRRRIAEDEIRSIYKKADAAHYMRHKRNPTLFTWEMFCNWREIARKTFERAEQGEMSADEFKAAISGR